MPLKETSKLNWSRPKLSQNVVVRCLNLFMPSSLWTDTLSPAALMWVSAVFWALLFSLRSPLYTVPMDSGPRGPHSDMCLGGFTPHFLSSSEVIFQQKPWWKNTRPNRLLKPLQWLQPAFFSLVGVALSRQKSGSGKAEKIDSPDIIKNICCIFAYKSIKEGT